MNSKMESRIFAILFINLFVQQVFTQEYMEAFYSYAEDNFEFSFIDVKSTSSVLVSMIGEDGCKISVKCNLVELTAKHKIFGKNNCAYLQLKKVAKFQADTFIQFIYNKLKFNPDMKFNVTFTNDKGDIVKVSSFKTPANEPSAVRNLKARINRENKLVVTWDRPVRVGEGITQYQVFFIMQDPDKHFSVYMKCEENCSTSSFSTQFMRTNDKVVAFNGDSTSLFYTTEGNIVKDMIELGVLAYNNAGFGSWKYVKTKEITK